MTDWLSHALAGNPVWDIGQLDKPTIRMLDKAVRAGSLVKSLECWCGLGRPRPVWHVPQSLNGVEG